MIYLIVFNVIIDVIKKKEDFRDKSQTFKQIIVSYELKD